MIQVTKAQAEIIEKVLERYKGDKARAAMNYQPNHLVGIETFTRCMIEGWEIAQEPHDKIRALYERSSYPMKSAILNVLNILGEQVEGVNVNVYQK